MKTKIEQLKATLEDKMIVNQEIEKPLDRLTADIRDIEKALIDLKKFIDGYQFQNDEEEIAFFKTIKPEILAQKFEAGLKYNILMNKPIGTNEILLRYFETELKSLQGFLRMNNFHYQYYRNGFSHLDRLYFLRNAEPLPVPVAEISETDNEFSTPMSDLFARFIAYEHVQYDMLEQITNLKYPDTVIPGRKLKAYVGKTNI